MKYELVNPSDKIFFDAPDVIHAAVAVSIISTSYGATCLEDGGEDAPIFMFGGGQEWVQEKAGMTVDEFIEKNAKALKETYESFRLDGQRTSINDIVSVAKQYATAIDKKFISGEVE